MHILFIDTETTGLNAIENDVIQIGAALWVDGAITNMVNEYCQPTRWDNISKQALETNKITMEQLKTFQSPKDAYIKIYELISQTSTKWVIGGQNIKFDYRFMAQFFAKNARPGDKSWEYLVDLEYGIDLMDISKPLKAAGVLNIANTKLQTVSESVGVVPQGQLHNALTDITVTMTTIEKTSRLMTDWLNKDMTKRSVLSKGLNRMYTEFGLIQ